MNTIFAAFIVLLTLPVIWVSNQLIARWCLTQRARFSPWFMGQQRAYFTAWFLIDLVLCCGFNFKLIDYTIMVVDYAIR